MGKVPVFIVKPGRRLTDVRREGHGRAYGYVLADRYGSLVLCCQRLTLAAAFLNTQSGDRVSVASLYEAAALGRRVHRRWSCKRMAVDEAAAAFEAARREQPTAKAAVLSWPHHLTVEAAVE